MATVVAGWDGSEGSERALALAATVAAEGDTLLVVSVVPAGLQERSFLEMLLPTIDVSGLIKPGSFTDRAKERLEARVKGLKTRAKVEAVVRAGDPADEILTLLQERDASHLIVGFKSYEKHLRYELGSIADKLVRHAPCAVTVVRWPAAQAR